MTAPADGLERRISTATAATFLGVTRRHVEKLIADGTLPAWDLRRAGAKRARWTVLVSSVRVLLAERRRNTRTEDRRAHEGVAKTAARERT